MKKILIHSNFCRIFTGFGKHKKNLLKYLYETGKYEIIEFANGLPYHCPPASSMPWTCFGSLPNDPKRIEEIQRDPQLSFHAGYGHEMIDTVIKEVKPDIYLGIEDIWAFGTFFQRKWWNKIHCIIHTTLDSLPILPDAIKAGEKIKHYFVWATFAEKALKLAGQNHVRTVRGSIDTSSFYRLPDQARKNLRKNHKLTDEFIIGFVFRNQLRKSVPNLLNGFKLFKDKNPTVKAKLLLHTHWAEGAGPNKQGWDIARLCAEKKIDFQDILTTYVCGKCFGYAVSQFNGHVRNCPRCNGQNSVVTTNIATGVSDKQLNEVYNLMDVYCHPFTSGGQEIPVQEAKLTELITLVTNYSCGEDLCTPESGGLPLEWSEYTEPNTQFIKASTSPTSIAEQIEKVYRMGEQEKRKMGQTARQFVLDNFSIESVGKQFEALFDSLPTINWDYNFDEESYDPEYKPDDQLADIPWIISLYKNILKTELSETDEGVTAWLQKFKEGAKRPQVLEHFKLLARQHNNESNRRKLFLELKKSDSSPKIAYILPSGGQEAIISSGLIAKLKKEYPNHNIYVFTNPSLFEYFDFDTNVFKVLEYSPQLEDILALEGRGSNEGFFDVVYHPSLAIANNSYIHNGKDLRGVNFS